MKHPTSDYEPPFSITPTILRLVAEISETLARYAAQTAAQLTPQQRRANRIRTIQASLAIENNTLSLDQVTAVIGGKRVLGDPREIHEVRNAFKAYETMADWREDREAYLLEAHQTLMFGLNDETGRYRSKGVSIFRGEALVHMAPPAEHVPYQMKSLLNWLRDSDLHPLIASCVFHYELEFIHPFADGNGRMGRLWQTMILRS